MQHDVLRLVLTSLLTLQEEPHRRYAKLQRSKWQIRQNLTPSSCHLSFRRCHMPTHLSLSGLAWHCAICSATACTLMMLTVASQRVMITKNTCKQAFRQGLLQIPQLY